MARTSITEKKKHTKRFFIILSSIISVVIVALVITGLALYINLNTDDIDNKFSKWTDHKINYDEISDILEDTDTANIFIFLYSDDFIDSSELSDVDKDDPMYSTYKETIQLVDLFYETIENKNNSKSEDELDDFNRIDFYLINVSLDGNESILSNADYGSISAIPGLIYIYADKYQEANPNNEKEILSGGGSYKAFNQVVTQAIDYINTDDRFN